MTNTMNHLATTDAHGLEMTGDRVAVELYDAAVDQLLRFNPSVISHLTAMLEEHPEAPMGHVMSAYLSLVSTDASDLGDVRQAATNLGSLVRTEREQAHSAVIERWLAGDWQGAALRLDDLLVRWPTDLLALMIGHQLDFFVGDAANLRDRVGRSLGALEPGHPHEGFVLGMHSFGLEECGHYVEAESAGMAALAAHPDDVWAVHAVAHVHEMRGDVGAGIRFMTTREADWGDPATDLFSVHLWWHLGLYLLEEGRTEEVLEIYDRHVHNHSSAAVSIEMLDASALLWRLHLDGVDTGNRFPDLADAWSRRTADEPWYVFNDVHAVMALCGAGRLADARAIVDRMDRTVSNGSTLTSLRRSTARAGMPAARGLVAHAEGRYGDAVDELLPVRRQLHVFGGSHAQRDVIQRTLVDSAIAAGRLDLADALVRERRSLRSRSDFALSRAARIAALRPA